MRQSGPCDSQVVLSVVNLEFFMIVIAEVDESLWDNPGSHAFVHYQAEVDTSLEKTLSVQQRCVWPLLVLSGHKSGTTKGQSVSCFAG